VARKLKLIITEDILHNLGNYYVQILKQNLIEHNKIASGELINSISYYIIKSKSGYKLFIRYPDYLANVDRGTKAKTIWPKKEIIKKWIKDKGLNIKESEQDKAAFLISRKIYRKGIKATNVIRDANADFDLDLIKDKVFKNVKSHSQVEWLFFIKKCTFVKIF